MTPLYKFSSAHLKDYGRQLGAFIAAEKQKGLAVEVGVELGIKVAVSSLPDLRGSDQDHAAVLVQVRGLASSSEGYCHYYLHLTAFFFCHKLPHRLPKSQHCETITVVSVET